MTNTDEATEITASTTSLYPLFRDGKGGLSLWDDDPEIFDLYREDPETKMVVPFHPDEYFRVTSKVSDTHQYVEIHVSYMKKRWWWFDTELHKEDLYRSIGEDITSDDILRLAVSTLMSWKSILNYREREAAALQKKEAHMKELERLKKQVSRFDGDYPPKVLK